MNPADRLHDELMAGDGGRASDVSGLRAALVETLRNDRSGLGTSADAERIAGLVLAVLSDPAFVLAALLAEHPDATIAALETLLTSDEAETEALRVVRVAEGVCIEAGYGPLKREDAICTGILAACRSLRPKAPKEDRDA